MTNRLPESPLLDSDQSAHDLEHKPDRSRSLRARARDVKRGPGRAALRRLALVTSS